MDDVVSIWRANDLIYSIANWAYWARTRDFKMRICSSSRFLFLVGLMPRRLRYHFNNVAVLHQLPSLVPPYECCPLLSVPSPPIFTHYSSVILENKFAASSLWHLAITECCVLAVMHFLVVACDGAIGYQSA